MSRSAMRLFAVLATCCGLIACARNPAGPNEGPLALGRWTGEGACLFVADADCNLTIGCGHGRFGRPTIRADGTFDVDGTYRIEVGPISIEPAPPAHFSGVVTGFRLTVTVVRSGSAPASYSMTQTAGGTCTVLCL